ncbi:MAG: protein translocase subunit SecF, partial [Chloroflexota bacterium]
DAIIQRTSDGDYLIRTRILTTEQRDANGQITAQGERQQLLDGLQEKFGSSTVLSFDEVSPVVAQEIGQRSALAVLVASVFILLYISFAFRQVPNPFRFGVCAIIALLHDVVVVVGAFSIFGKLFGTEVDSMFITAVLTVIGFSVHDTIVVFDRTRENQRRMPGRDLPYVVNVSLNQTLARSMATSITVVLTLVALLLFGGVTIQNFVLTLLIGIISGTYSSIFLASQLLVMWELGELKWSRWFGRAEAKAAA